MNEIIKVAAAEIGYKESPANSNRTKYGKWFGFNSVPWCAIFVSWVYAQAGKPLPSFQYSKGFAGCQYGVEYFRRQKKITTTPVEGDIVFFDWNGDKRYDHTGIFVRWINDHQFETIEGNTAIGNDSNGGEVMRRTDRYRKFAIFVHP